MIQWLFQLKHLQNLLDDLTQALLNQEIVLPPSQKDSYRSLFGQGLQIH
jgi:hypothetical protein